MNDFSDYEFCGMITRSASKAGIRIKPMINGNDHYYQWFDPAGARITSNPKPTKREALVDACEMLVSYFTRPQELERKTTNAQA